MRLSNKPSNWRAQWATACAIVTLMAGYPVLGQAQQDGTDDGQWAEQVDNNPNADDSNFANNAQYVPEAGASSYDTGLPVGESLSNTSWDSYATTAVQDNSTYAPIVKDDTAYASNAYPDNVTHGDTVPEQRRVVGLIQSNLGDDGYATTAEDAAYDQPNTVALNPQPKVSDGPRVYNSRYGQQLMDATRSGNLGTVRWLLQQGADPNYVEDVSKATPLYLAIKSGWVELAQIFQEYGADLTKGNETGTTPLHVAAAAGKLPMVEYLVGLGVEPNVKTNKDWTPLHHAARFGHSDVVYYLLNKGANPNSFTSDGFTAMGLAEQARQYQAAHDLQAYTQAPARVDMASRRGSNSGNNVLASAGDSGRKSSSKGKSAKASGSKKSTRTSKSKRRKGTLVGSAD